MLPISARFTPTHRRFLSKPISFFLHKLLTTQSSSIEYTLSHPIYTIWGANTGVGKTLVSTGLAASILSPLSISSIPTSKFIYIKPVQTGFPADSDSRFVYRKFSEIFLHRRPQSTVFASNHVLKASIPAAKAVLDCGVGEGAKCDSGFRDLGWYEERKLGGEEGAAVAKLICKTMYGWREAVSPHLAAEREGAVIGDSVLLKTLDGCLGIDLEGGGEGGQKVGVWSVIETAGGVASPGPSGSLQCDLYRYGVA